MDERLIQIRKKLILDLVNNEKYVPMKIKEIAILLNIPKDERKDLEAVLKLLVKEGLISLSQKGKYGKPEENKKEGIFTGNARGFGFVSIEGEEEDIFIPENATGTAMNNDRVIVVVRPGRNGKRQEGEVIKVLERSATEVVGLYQESKNFGFVVADNPKIFKDIFIQRKKSMGAINGHKVIAKIIDYGKSGQNPEGEIIRIIGHINDPGVDILSIVLDKNIPMEFPQEVMEQVKDVPEKVTEEEYAGRMDIRSWKTVTIDGEDAKDLDDAITLSSEGGRYTLGVHIADVTHYVRENSPLDEEALIRGTSVYLADRVIPMLPHKLSNGICSLNEGQDRLALSCIMEIDSEGKVTSHKIAETVIHVDRRMTYTSVKKILEDEDPEEISKYIDLVSMFKEMRSLAQILKKVRRDRGSIDFDFPETKIILNPNGKPIEIKPYDRNIATKIIEDFMLIANETVAEDFFWQELPFVYRSHEAPDPDKVLKLGMFINNFGHSIHVGQQEMHPKEMQKLLDRIEGSDEEMMISRLMLRSMKQARYSTTETTHFGLATKYYCHFTSPIRRYPDLQIHRIIKENLSGRLNERRITHYEFVLPTVASQCSVTERRAEEAERETIKLKKVEYMQQFVGEEFDGVVSGITKWGMYVELPNTVEGMVHISAIPGDYFDYDEEHYEMVGKATNKRYKLGQNVRVKLVKADKLLRNIDFELTEGGEDSGEGIV
ncbi:ribonuclease R [Parasporobacterium paucivorans]|uniref:Ribonuclease R n=1 Tax=Parasporobacterium paucivorans DSM 15970 TaxID=1122934 RepID=A0A1M6DMQ1_9FIRM|nr:ribonuclease R [Parasporobacterium paucivorans]SHI74465.1 RNAse R [Parasporobacterium paucivorans DSM 15970]